MQLLVLNRFHYIMMTYEGIVYSAYGVCILRITHITIKNQHHHKIQSARIVYMREQSGAYNNICSYLWIDVYAQSVGMLL